MTRRITDPVPRSVPASRLARLGRLGHMASGVAGAMALGGLRQLGTGHRPQMRELLLTPGNIRRITDDLARMRGAAMKIGQLVSMDGADMVPPELAEIMARLRAEADFMPPRQLRDALDAAWGPGWLSRFESFDVRPIAAASIGQVHRARLKDGRELAIKVQYPGVARSIDSDVANVGTLIRWSGLLPEGFELAPYLEEARRQLHEETDYGLEAGHLDRFRTLLADDPAFAVPGLAPDLCTRAVLAMTFQPGGPIEALADAPQAERDRVAERLIGLTLRELFAFGLMQTDPNFANYRHDPATGRIVLLDFGATRAFGPDVAAQYRRLMVAGLAGDTSGLDDTCAAIGFVGPLTAPAHRARIVTMIGMVFEAIAADPVFDFGRTDLPARMQAQGHALAEDGFVPPPLPMDVLYLQRKFGGMFMLASRLGARVPVRAMLDDIIVPA